VILEVLTILATLLVIAAFPFGLRWARRTGRKRKTKRSDRRQQRMEEQDSDGAK